MCDYHSAAVVGSAVFGSVQVGLVAEQVEGGLTLVAAGQDAPVLIQLTAQHMHTHASVLFVTINILLQLRATSKSYLYCLWVESQLFQEQ